jgi:hypothetical protein
MNTNSVRRVMLKSILSLPVLYMIKAKSTLPIFDCEQDSDFVILNGWVMLKSDLSTYAN